MSVMYLSEGSSNVLSYYVRVMILTHGDTGHSMCFIFLCHERNICPVHCLTCTSPFHWTSAASSVQRPIYVCPLKRSKRSLFHYEYDFKIRFDPLNSKLLKYRRFSALILDLRLGICSTYFVSLTKANLNLKATA